MSRFLSPLHRPTLGALVVVLTLCALTYAQTFPSKPLKLVVPFGPGGSSDVVARIMADGAGEALGQTMLIENVPGAGGNIGTARVVKAASDGYTLVECTIGTCAINPSIYAQTGYDLRKDFAPVFLVGGVMNIFTVHPSMPVKSIAELVAYVKANPGKLPVAIGAVGSSNHLNAAFNAAIRNPRIKARLEEAGLRLVGGAPGRLDEQIRGESERWAKVVKANNVKVE